MLRIMLGDLRHRLMGRHSTLFPLSIGYIAAYCTKMFDSEIEIKLYDDPDLILLDINSWKPQIVGLSNYMWNAEINNLVFNHVKNVLPDTVCVAGGPEFPIDTDDAEQYLQKRASIDFYCQWEGEIAFANLISRIKDGETLSQLKSRPLAGMAFIGPRNNTIVCHDHVERIQDINMVPSPYLTGLFDRYFNGEYTPAIQTARGCPFSCQYCRASHTHYSKVIPFALERVREEIDYIAQRGHCFKSVGLSIMDSNFGILERDVKIAEHIRQVQDQYGWPNTIQADTTKNNYERVFNIVSIVQNKMRPLCSLQTTNKETLKLIKRENLPFDEYERMQKKLVNWGMKPGTELIIPLPLEMKESFLETLRKVYAAGMENIVVFTWMMLPGTGLASKEFRKKYRLRTGYRIIPRQFGVYNGNKCFEIEEICYETSTMSFDDYLQCRGCAFLSYLLGRSQYDLVKKALDQFSLDVPSFLLKIFEKIYLGQSWFAMLFQNMLQETKDEIYGSREEVSAVYSQPENYKKLLRGEIGDNVFRKYLTRVLMDAFPSSIESIFEVISALMEERGILTDIHKQFLDMVRKWLLVSRDFSNVLRDDNFSGDIAYEEFEFDIDQWSRDKRVNPIEVYRHKIRPGFYYDTGALRSLVSRYKDLYGDDIYYCLGQVLNFYSPNVLWKKCILSEKR